MNKYRLRVHSVVRAKRFDDPHSPPKYVHGTNGQFVLETQPKKYAIIEVGDFIVYEKDGTRRPINYDTFVTLYERIFDVDGEDVSEEYRGTDVEAQ